MTDLPPAGVRLSPRSCAIGIMLITTVASEVVARRSLPPPPQISQGLVANLIPFKSINLTILIHISLGLAWGLVIAMSEYWEATWQLGLGRASSKDGVLGNATVAKSARTLQEVKHWSPKYSVKCEE